MFQVFNLVKVISQPHSLKHLVDLVGQVGYIEEINEEKALFQGLTIDGRLNDTGWIPLQCLIVENSSHWKEAYQKFKIWMNQLSQQNQETQSRLQKIADRYSISIEKVLEISQAATM